MVGKKILYFIKGPSPTEEERKAAIALGTLRFRSTQSYSRFDFVEDCDGVAGCVPAEYIAKGIPRVDEIKPKQEPKPEKKVESVQVQPKVEAPPQPVANTSSTPPPPPPPVLPWTQQ